MRVRSGPLARLTQCECRLRGRAEGSARPRGSGRIKIQRQEVAQEARKPTVSIALVFVLCACAVFTPLAIAPSAVGAFPNQNGPIAFTASGVSTVECDPNIPDCLFTQTQQAGRLQPRGDGLARWRCQ